MKIGLLGAVAVATTVFADLHTVLTLKHLMESTIAYHESLTAFDGTYAKGISLWRKSGDLVNTLKAAGAHPNASLHERLTPEEDEQLEQEGFDVAYSLVRETHAAIDTAMSKKPLLDGIPLLGKRIALQYFKNMHQAASHLGGLFGPKASEGRRHESQALVEQLDDEFKRGLDAFKK